MSKIQSNSDFLELQFKSKIENSDYHWLEFSPYEPPALDIPVIGCWEFPLHDPANYVFECEFVEHSPGAYVHDLCPGYTPPPLSTSITVELGSIESNFIEFGTPELTEYPLLIPGDIILSGNTLQSVSFEQIHNLVPQSPLGQNAGIENPTLIGIHSFAINPLIVSSPLIGEPALTEDNNLNPGDLGLAPITHGASSLVQNHSLNADSIEVAQATMENLYFRRIIETEISEFNLDSVIFENPLFIEYQSEKPISLVLELPVFESPNLIVNHFLDFNDLISPAVSLDQLNLQQIHSFGISDLSTSSVITGNPILEDSFTLRPSALIVQTIEYGLPGFDQTHNLITDGIAIPIEIGNPFFLESYSFVFNDPGVQNTTFDEPEFIKIAIAEPVSIETNSIEFANPEFEESYSFSIAGLGSIESFFGNALFDQTHNLITNDISTSIEIGNPFFRKIDLLEPQGIGVQSPTIGLPVSQQIHYFNPESIQAETTQFTSPEWEDSYSVQPFITVPNIEFTNPEISQLHYFESETIESDPTRFTNPEFIESYSFGITGLVTSTIESTPVTILKIHVFHLNPPPLNPVVFNDPAFEESYSFGISGLHIPITFENPWFYQIQNLMPGSLKSISPSIGFPFFQNNYPFDPVGFQIQNPIFGAPWAKMLFFTFPASLITGNTVFSELEPITIRFVLPFRIWIARISDRLISVSGKSNKTLIDKNYNKQYLIYPRDHIKVITSKINKIVAKRNLSKKNYASSNARVKMAEPTTRKFTA